jgi:hypothetical protein
MAISMNAAMVPLISDHMASTITAKIEITTEATTSQSQAVMIAPIIHGTTITISISHFVEH